MDTAQLLASINQSVPIGVGHERGIEALDSLGIEHSDFDPSRSHILAIARGVKKGLITRTDIQLTFGFDSTGVLTSIRTEEVHTGP